MVLSLLIIAFVAFSAYRGWRRGLTLEVVELVGLVAAILLAVLVGPVLGAVLNVVTPLDESATRAAGWILVFAAAVVGVVFASRWVRKQGDLLPRPGRIAQSASGGVFGATWSALLVTGVLVLSVTVPGARARTGEPICDSRIARTLIGDANPLHRGGERIAELGRPAMLWASQRIFDTFTLAHPSRICEQIAAGNAEDALRSFRFPPAARDEISAEEELEQSVLRLINNARRAEGVSPLYMDPLLQEVARGHARDMYRRGYFDHATPECARGPARPRCRDPFDRMDEAGAVYEVAGENLALAPTVSAAHQGLMGSPGHRRNILDPRFERAGIGVIAGPFGLMVAQEFAG